MKNARQWQNSSQYIESLLELRYFSGNPVEFWHLFFARTGSFFHAEHSLLLVSDQKQWVTRLVYPEGTALAPDTIRFMAELADKTRTAPNNIAVDSNSEHQLICGQIELEQQKNPAVICLIISKSNEQEPDLLRNLFQLVADIPKSYLHNTYLKQQGIQNKTALEVLEILTLLQQSKGYKQSLITLCNEICTRYQYLNVSFGWVNNGYVRLEAISQNEKFNRSMTYCQSIENAMEEALDQNNEIIFPDTSSNQININHRALSKQNDSGVVISLPIRRNSEVIAIVTVEKRHNEATSDELTLLRILCDQLADKLWNLKLGDKNWAIRSVHHVKRKASQWFGIENSFLKLSVLTTVLVIMAIGLTSWPYRIEAEFVVKAEDSFYVTAPIDGYIQSSHVKTGDSVLSKQPLVQLNTDDLKLQEANLVADLNRLKREVEKHRAKNALAEMRIANSRYQQSYIRLQQVREYINKATITAPENSVVVEGDLSRMHGAPVRKGDVLLQLSSLNQLSAELMLDESLIHEIHKGQTGSISFQSQPDKEYPIQISRISPAALVKDGNNVFTLTADLNAGKQSWWHPGMTGIAKIDAGERNLFWILTHQTSNYLRLFFWI